MLTFYNTKEIWVNEISFLLCRLYSSCFLWKDVMMYNWMHSFYLTCSSLFTLYETIYATLHLTLCLFLNRLWVSCSIRRRSWSSWIQQSIFLSIWAVPDFAGASLTCSNERGGPSTLSTVYQMKPKDKQTAFRITTLAIILEKIVKVYFDSILVTFHRTLSAVDDTTDFCALVSPSSSSLWYLRNLKKIQNLTIFIFIFAMSSAKQLTKAQRRSCWV